MLPPVSAASNIYLTHQETRAPGIAAGVGASAGAGAGVNTVTNTPRALEQNTEIAGRLNLLLLTGQERMSQNLAVLVDLLGSALKMERLPDETLSGFAVRLVEALSDLSPRERFAVQRLLVQTFAGLQLRTLIEAFRNPAGPEAATLSIYLELYRQKDRDLAARSVVTSYRQNSGEARAPAAAIQTSASDSALPSPVAQSTADRRDINNQTAVRPMPAERHAVAPFVEDGNRNLDGMTRHVLAGRLEQSQAAASRPAPAAVDTIPPVRGQQPSLDVAPHLLQAHLDEAFSAGKPIAARGQEQSADLSPPAGNRSPSSIEDTELDDKHGLPAGLRHKDVGQDTARVGGVDRDLVEQDEDNAMFAALPGAAGSMPVTLATSLAALQVEAAETDLVRALLNLQGQDGNDDVTRADSVHSDADDRMAMLQEVGVARTVPDEDAVDLAQAARIRNGGFEEQVVYATTPPLTETPEILLHSGLREVIPVPFVNYLIADDFKAEPTEVDERRHSGEDEEAEDDRPEDDGAEQADEDRPDDGSAGAEQNEHDHDQAAQDDAVEEEPVHSLGATEPAAVLVDLSFNPRVTQTGEIDDPAHDLYVRMSGLI
ncbi:hypothetical protein [Rhizobium sp. SL42]|uniref:hypothetical protein n=1 Tax=Rhizobium sp. SL42 TaxID=2806346 RepID=UPI001F2783C1|nr:hypothetical protein [Rhizobium sp. SL42]UJW75549.1 hypothetical protein IM739_03325 [Rhizobium sp. SL42]